MAKADIQQRVNQYIKLEQDKAFKEEAEQLVKTASDAELRAVFGDELEFGTGGLRGVVGCGFSRMNSYVVARATQGLITYIKSLNTGRKKLSAIIAYDSRTHSKGFARTVAEVCAGNDILAKIFVEPRPTPMLSYTVRQEKADFGIVITASHNPPEYNGYKVFWKDGAQIVAPHDTSIIAQIKETEQFARMPYNKAQQQSLVVELEKQHDTKYMQYVRSLSYMPNTFRHETAQAFKVVYTPLHGTGGAMVKPLAEQIGIDCTIVPEQEKPDGSFPTIASPNPEDPKAFDKALVIAKKIGANLVVATDPDADRLGIGILHDGKYLLLNGNQTGALLIDYALNALKRTGKLPKKPVVIKTIVTTELQRVIAHSYGAQCYDTLTGFKHIASKIRDLEQNSPDETFVIGGEESFGYIIGDKVRDKDGVAATILATEMALYYHQQQKTLKDRLDELYLMHGYYEEFALSKYFKGASGMKKMEAIMDRLRTEPPELIGNISVQRIEDYLMQTSSNLSTGSVQPMEDLPKSNVLKFMLSDNTVVCARPSGTEPKIKFYCSSGFTPNNPLAQARSITHSLIDTIANEIKEWIK